MFMLPDKPYHHQPSLLTKGVLKTHKPTEYLFHRHVKNGVVWDAPETIHQTIIHQIQACCLWGKNSVSFDVKHTPSFLYDYYNLPVYQTKQLAKLFRLEGFSVKVKHSPTKKTFIISW